MSGLRVYGWNFDGRHRAICAARSRRAVLRAVQALGYSGTSYGHLRDYGCWTGNRIEIDAANAQPGSVLIAREPHCANDFKALEPIGRPRQ